MSDSTTLDKDELRERAMHNLATQPRPFLRWAGSKRLLLPQLVNALPESFGSYYEPFLGSGALYFLLRPKKAVLNDTCRELVDTFGAVRRDVDKVIRSLRPLKPNRDMFYQIRSNRSRNAYTRAAEFIYLNKTCWNGLYRVNSKGQFNVPYGRPKTDAIVDEANIRSCSKLLRRADVQLQSGDFAVSVASAGEGDLVFLDPPYVTRHNDNGFVDYNERLFGWDDQIRLAKTARDLVKRGAHVLVANAYHRDLLDLYTGFSISKLNRASTLASNSSKRGRVTEALFWQASTRHGNA